jgi:flagellar biosynthetic protein FliO
VLALAAGQPLPEQPAHASAAPAAEAAHSLAPGLPSGLGLSGPIAVLLLLGAAALLLSRRRRAPARRIQVVETTAIGPRKSLVLARLGDELLLLGATDAGITLLRRQPAPRESPSAVEARPLVEAQPADPGSPPASAPGEAAATLVDLAARFVPGRRRARAERPAAFEALLLESAEDQELRRKLAAGRAGSIQ